MGDPTAALAFLHDGPEVTVDVIDRNGPHVRELIDDRGAFFDPDGKRAPLLWSRDGHHLLLYSAKRGLLSLEPDGGLNAVKFGGWCDPGQLAWSPDRRLIACNSGDGINLITTAGPRALFEDKGIGDTSKFEPAWSPDGYTLMYLDGDCCSRSVAFYDFARKKSRYVHLDGPAALVHAPAWSPDGRWVAFSRGCDVGCATSIWIMHPNGRGLARLVRDGSRPAWSPDGAEIAFDSRRDGDFEIYVITVATGRVRQITHNTVDDESVVWR
jgi:dipeptidyl aminopeptidase/acylaminoacyl peptidase